MTTLEQHQHTAPPDPDSDQLPAIQAPPGPIIIVGGAGSGKTHALAARIKHLIDAGHNPATISCLTMSSRNSDHLRQLLDISINDPETTRRIFICTYHHMASTLLRTTGAAAYLGISPHYTIWDADQSIQVIQSLIEEDKEDEEQLTMPNSEVRDIVSWDGLNRARWKMNPPLPPKEAYWFDILDEYNHEKKRQNVLDLNDLIPMAVQALETIPNIRSVWRSIRTKHLLADDFHDLSPIQYRLLQLMTGTDQSIFIAVDPNQSVYSWRGADPRLINKFKLDYNAAKTFVLHHNHRHTVTLHKTLQTILEDEEMTGLVPSRQRPTRTTPGQPPRGITFNGLLADMNNHMFDLIEADVREGRYQWGEIAILYRRKALGSNFITQLVSRNIPYTIVGENDGPDKGTTRRTVALLTLALNPWDTATFSAAATAESDDTQRGLNSRTTAAIARISREEHINLIKAAEKYLPTLSKGVRNQKNLQYVIRAYAGVVAKLDDPATQLPELCLETEQISHASRAERYTTTPPNPEASKLLTMSRNCLQLPHETLRQQLARFLESIKNSSYPELQSDENVNPYAHNSGLIVSSIHAAKGKDWKSVWVMNATDNIMPGNVDRLPTMTRLEEEQRLFYLAASRATDMLTFIHATSDGLGTSTPRTRFLDVLDDLITWTHAPEEPKE